MPRPGPRPYECVRRAWHSDTHQPIRGCLIQEIFRVVNEIHNSATKKNKEWQEKLPIVVLKAEEIIYSKANSEAEYMDLKTIWGRTNDAIDTIIRHDKSSETGQLLRPCIEAALNLGCTPRRASRSQRNNNPRSYLTTASPSEPTHVPPNNLENIIQGNHTMKSPFVSHNNSNFIKSTTMNANLLGSESQCSIPQKDNLICSKYRFYPLYYGNQLQSQVSEFSFEIPPNSNSDNATLSEIGCDLANLRENTENPFGIRCDLSLRLGPLSVPCISVENSWPQEVEDVGSNTSPENREFSFFPKANGDDPLDSCSSKWSSETENMNIETTMRKRKATSDLSEDRQFC
ncbi:hypothetical protein ACSBR2_040181 [Camellia fascicularis]